MILIDAMLKRLGVSRWVAIGVLCVAAGAAALAYRAHLVEQGIAIEAARRDAIDKKRDKQAKAALSQANARTAAVQVRLDAALATITQQGKEISDAQARSAALQSDLAAGRRRLSVAVTGACHAAPDGHGQSEPATELDSAGGPTTASLDGRAAADLEWMRQTRNDAIVGLQACAAVYDAVKAASDNQVQ
jgi:hypothetical protein